MSEKYKNTGAPHHRSGDTREQLHHGDVRLLGVVLPPSTHQHRTQSSGCDVLFSCCSTFEASHKADHPTHQMTLSQILKSILFYDPEIRIIMNNINSNILKNNLCLSGASWRGVSSLRLPVVAPHLKEKLIGNRVEFGCEKWRFCRNPIWDLWF